VPVLEVDLLVGLAESLRMYYRLALAPTWNRVQALLVAGPDRLLPTKNRT
jgi:hypothetical protein